MGKCSTDWRSLTHAKKKQVNCGVMDHMARLKVDSLQRYVRHSQPCDHMHSTGQYLADTGM